MTLLMNFFGLFWKKWRDRKNIPVLKSRVEFQFVMDFREILKLPTKQDYLILCS